MKENIKIKCEECGQMIYCHNKFCPNCGSPTEKRLVCNECYGSVSPNDEVCPNCGNPLKNKLKKTKLSYKTTLLCIIAAIAIVEGFVVISNVSNSRNRIIDDNENINRNQEADETQQTLEEETRERNRKAIVGTYYFSPRKDN